MEKSDGLVGISGTVCRKEIGASALFRKLSGELAASEILLADRYCSSIPRHVLQTWL
jgi:hypothetical protein